MTYSIIPWDGKPISEPGLYSGVPMETYHGMLCVGHSISKSVGWVIADESPAHAYLGHYSNPDREEIVESEAFVMGRAAHHLLLGQEGFLKEFALRPETYPGDKGEAKPWNGNANYCRSWLQTAKDSGKTVIKGDQIANIKGMAAALHRHPMVESGILNGLVEHTLVFQHRETGVWIKVRPDTIPTASGDVADLKTAVSVTDEAISKAISENGYFMQGGMIRMALREVLKVDMSGFTLVFSEKKPPHCVRVKTLKPDDLDLGEELAELAIRSFARCVDTGVWPGPGGVQTDAEYVEMLPWARTKLQHRIMQMKQELAIND